MKKIAIFIILLMFSTISLVNSAEFSGGIKLGSATLDVEDKTETTLNKKSGDESADYGALFIEAKLDTDLPVGLSIGFEFIPVKAVLDVDNSANTESYNASGLSGDYEMTVKNHKTLYLQASKEITNGFSILGRVGYVHASISDVNSSTATLTSKDGSLDGYTVGIGIQKDISTVVADYVRLAVDYIDYNSVEAKSSTKTYSGDAEATTITLSVGKKF